MTAALLGGITIVGSGGGGLDCLFCGGSMTPIIALGVWPERQGVQVGESAVFFAWAEPNNAVQRPITYRWCRRPAAGGACVEIEGATDIALTLPAANLGDDGSVLVATVRGVNAEVTAQGTLFVSNTPPVAVEDGEFVAADWAAPVAAWAASAPAPRAEHVATGGNPGAFRQLVQTVPAGPSQSSTFFSASRAVVYDPAVLGAIYGLELRADLGLLERTRAEYGVFVGVSLALDQGERRYVAAHVGIGISVEETLPGWASQVAGWRGLVRVPAEAFYMFEGPPCGAGEACPDFSAGAPPLRLVLAHTVGQTWATSEPLSVTYGIDNLTLTVWRR